MTGHVLRAACILISERLRGLQAEGGRQFEMTGPGWLRSD